MIQDLINKLKHLPDDRIGDGIFVAYQWSDNRLIRLFIGSKINGPMLQYDVNGHGKYTGILEVDYKNGCWTNCYSRGNFGKKYAFGGNWSGHNKNLHPKLKLSPIMDEKTPVVINGEKSGTLLDMDCSGGWSIWYTSAKQALDARLTIDEIKCSSLPEITKQHLLKNETSNVIESLKDIIEAYEL
jgi:hypothetical protein